MIGMSQTSFIATPSETPDSWVGLRAPSAVKITFCIAPFHRFSELGEGGTVSVLNRLPVSRFV